MSSNLPEYPDSAAPQEPNALQLPKNASPDLTGGQGFLFEDLVATTYAAALLAELPARGTGGRTVAKVSLQQYSQGQPMDDLIVTAMGNDGVEMHLSLQAKRGWVISDAPRNHDFKDCIHRAYKTVSGTGFRIGVDCVGVVTETISSANKATWEALCEWARHESDTGRLLAKLQTDRVAGAKLDHFNFVRSVLALVTDVTEVDAAAHQLLAHFVLLQFDVMNEGAADRASAVACLANCLLSADRSRVSDLWNHVAMVIKRAQGTAAGLDRGTLVARLNGAFRLQGAPSMAAKLSAIAASARLRALEIVGEIGDIAVVRTKTLEEVRAASKVARFVQLRGLPGTGKSVVLKRLVGEALALGPILFLKSDRLTGASWNQYASSEGFGTSSLESILIELEATGSPLILIDGLDRVEPQHRGVVNDIIGTVLGSPLLGNWRVIASVRDSGIELVRTWLPPALFEAGLQVVEVREFSDAEAEQLAAAKPGLRGMLFGSEPTRSIVRRPFFASILARLPNTQNATSEVDLATAWWLGGGYSAEGPALLERRKALIQLAQSGAHTLGRRIRIGDIASEPLHELQVDGVIQTASAGHDVQFAHDIYFEWAFLQLLVREREGWLQEVIRVGEPPALGRVIELLSHLELQQGASWQSSLERLEATKGIRTQWLRAWLLGPFGMANFELHQPLFTSAALSNGAERLGKLLLWYQAEKTVPNPMILQAETYRQHSLAERVRLADLVAWPADFASCQRCLKWLLSNLVLLPAKLRPEVLSIFEIWQNVTADFGNPVSGQIVSLSLGWLTSQETPPTQGARANVVAGGTGQELDRGVREEFEERLRRLVLRAARSYPALVKAYLVAWTGRERFSQGLVKQFFGFSGVLSEVCPSELVDLTLKIVMKRLLVDKERANRERGHFTGARHDFDWRELALDDQQCFFPCAPTREPFHSLFLHAPAEARRLVRQVTNHATTAWRQLHRLDWENRATPLPLVLTFPWGRQVFWGSGREYLWFRGVWGSHVVGSALMALEEWTHREARAGRPVDEIVRDVLEGQTSVAAVAVAVNVVIGSQHCSDVTLPLFSNSRIWQWDISRLVNDMGMSASTIGFRPHDRDHYAAVVDLTKHASHQSDIRTIATLCIARRGELADRASKAISAFATDLPFDFAEQRDDPQVAADVARQTSTWSDIANIEYYRLERAPDPNYVAVVVEGPATAAAHAEGVRELHAKMTHLLSLLVWTDKSFEAGKLDDRHALEQAVSYARSLDSSALFDEVHAHTEPGRQTQAGVAGVAAVVLALGVNPSETDLDWAYSVCQRALLTQETAEDANLYTHSILLYHPVMYAARGLAARIRRAPHELRAAKSLVCLVAHPFSQIAEEAVAGLLAAWECNSSVAWAGLGLAFDLSIFSRLASGRTREEHYLAHQKKVKHAIDAGFTRLQQPTTAAGLPDFPPAWVPAASPKRRAGRWASVVESNWEYPTEDFEPYFLRKILHHIPVEIALQDEFRRGQFLDFCSAMLAWTLERLEPSWHRAEDHDEDFESSDMHEWIDCLARFLGEISVRINPEDALSRFVRPILGMSDKPATALLAPFVSRLACHLMDTPVFADSVCKILGAVVPRILAHRAWERASWDRGHVSDHELSRIVRALFFVEIPEATGAARFANGEWQDISKVLHLSAPIVTSRGAVVTVVTSFLSMCELASTNYPLSIFVAQLAEILPSGGAMPLGWHGTLIPARIAGQIQIAAEAARPLATETAQSMLKALDALVDWGDRRSAAIQSGEVFRNVRVH